MGLSCGCDYDDWDGDGTAYYKPNDFIKMPWFDRRKRCLSCKSFINPGEQVAKFDGFRMPNCDYEINRFGDGTEIDMASKYLCEKCSEIFFNLEDLGFCVDMFENMNDLLEEYKNDYKDI